MNSPKHGTPSLADAIYELESPSSPDGQVAALRHLKNEIIGHAEKKEILIQLGIVDVLAHTLAISPKLKGKRKSQETNGTQNGRPKASAWTVEDEVRLQAIVLLGSLAHGGPVIVTPILAGSTISCLVSALPPTENPGKIVLASLRTLVAIANTARLASPRMELFRQQSEPEPTLLKATVRVFAEVLSQRSHSVVVQSQIVSLCHLISQAFISEQYRVILVEGGILDLLAARLAAYYVHQGFWSSRASSSIATALPPSPSRETLPHLLSAVGAVTQSSKYRVARLLYSPIASSIFPFHVPEVSVIALSTPVQQGTGKHASSIEFSLPEVPLGHAKSHNDFSKAFPALSSVQPQAKHSALMDFAESDLYALERNSSKTGQESSLISWLIYMIRTERGLCRVTAARLLTSIARAGFLSKNRDRMLALLVVPLLVSMMDEPAQHRSGSPGSESEARTIREQAPAILAELIQEKPLLQKAAADAGAIKKICQMLKQTFDTIDIKPCPWSPNISSPPPSGTASSRKIGPRGLRGDVVHIMSCREGALRLLAAIADKEDKYRKILMENGIVPCIIDSLVPFKEEILAELNGQVQSPRKYKFSPGTLGNSIPVIIAACSAARALSRSVSLLRTSLIDAGVAKPVFALLKHSNVSVLVEATNVVCNLVTDFSPMRHDLLEAGAIKTLCEHAHSADSQIRLVSLWALKHLIYQAPNDVKLQCLEELGSGWLVQIITGGSSNGNSTRSLKSSQPLSMGVANAAGERVDILNAIDDESMDTNEDGASGTVHDGTSEDSMLASLNLLWCNISVVDLSAISAQHRPRLKEIKALEDNHTVFQAHGDELLIQVQGLDFVRNLIQGPAAAEMIDRLFQELGANRVFDILASKLQNNSAPKVTCPPQTNSGTTSSIPVWATNTNTTSLHAHSFPPTGLLTSAVFILVHIAAGLPRHRQQLMSRPDVLSLLLPLLSHPDSKIRVTCVWVVNNLTWVDDQGDAVGARQRAIELRGLGFEEALVRAKDDEALDVRERVATAREQMAVLLGTEGGGGRR